MHTTCRTRTCTHTCVVLMYKCVISRCTTCHDTCRVTSCHTCTHTHLYRSYTTQLANIHTWCHRTCTQHISPLNAWQNMSRMTVYSTNTKCSVRMPNMLSCHTYVMWEMGCTLVMPLCTWLAWYVTIYSAPSACQTRPISHHSRTECGRSHAMSHIADINLMRTMV